MKSCHRIGRLWLWTLAVCMVPSAPSAAANLVLTNGVIYTVDTEQPWAEALAIDDGGTIIAIGSEAEVLAAAGGDVDVADLAGRFVMPGIHDVHTHPLEAFDQTYTSCSLQAGVQVEEQLEALAACAHGTRDEAWLFGWGYSIDDILVTSEPPAALLDRIAPNRPALIMENSSHAMWANSMALELAGYGAETPNPPGGVIVKDPQTGQPTGLLIDNAGNMVRELALQPSEASLERTYAGLLEALDELARHGITSVGDARVYWGRRHHEVWLRAETEGTLSVRAVLALWGYPQYGDEQMATLRQLYSNDPDKLVRLSQIKLYADGVTFMTTGAMIEPYEYHYPFVPGNRGLNYFGEERMSRWISELELVGFDFNIHAIGDRGVREALNAIEAASRANGTRDRRHRLTHVEMVDPQDIPRFAQLGAIADFQLASNWTDPREMQEDTEPLIGDRARDAFPIASVMAAGAMVTLSSDFDVSDMNPFPAMTRALTRSRENLTNLEDVVRAYTLNAAYTLRQEERVGSLEVGKAADLIVLDRNIFEIPPAQIAGARVIWTLFGGEEVYRASGFKPFE